MVFRADKPDAMPPCGAKFLSQNRRGHAHQLAAVVEIELRCNFADEPVTFLGDGSRGRVELQPFEILSGALQKRDFIRGEQWKQMLHVEREPPKNDLVPTKNLEFGRTRAVKNGYVS